MNCHAKSRLYANIALLSALAAACQPIEHEGPDHQQTLVEGEGATDGVGEQQQAVTATGLAADQIRRVKNHSIDVGLRQAYFARAVSESPQWTADGVGAFQFFSGDFGYGAIYYHEYATSAGRSSATFPVYGAILPAWAGAGYESVVGYPNSEEQDASDRSDRTPCASQGGVRQQLFGDVRWDGPDGGGASEVVLCWSPERGVWALPVEVAQGLAGQRYIERVPDLP